MGENLQAEVFDGFALVLGNVSFNLSWAEIS